MPHQAKLIRNPGFPGKPGENPQAVEARRLKALENRDRYTQRGRLAHSVVGQRAPGGPRVPEFIEDPDFIKSLVIQKATEARTFSPVAKSATVARSAVDRASNAGTARFIIPRTRNRRGASTGPRRDGYGGLGGLTGGGGLGI